MNWIKFKDSQPPQHDIFLFYDGCSVCIAYYAEYNHYEIKPYAKSYYCNDPSCHWIYDDCDCPLIVTDDCYWSFIPELPISPETAAEREKLKSKYFKEEE